MIEVTTKNALCSRVIQSPHSHNNPFKAGTRDLSA